MLEQLICLPEAGRQLFMRHGTWRLLRVAACRGAREAEDTIPAATHSGKLQVFRQGSN